VGVAVGRDDRLRRLGSTVPGVHLWSLDLCPRPGDERSSRLDAEDRARVAGLRPVDADRLRARRVLLRTALAEIGDDPPEALRLRTDGPFRAELAGGTWYVSVSSSGDRGLLAAAAVPVGVDLEALPGPPDALRVARAFLPPAEQAWIAAGGPDVADRFLATWVRKEAVVKCTGEGMARDLRSFVVDAAAVSAPVRDAAGELLPLRTAAVSLPGHAAALALAVPGPAGAGGVRGTTAR
jgi:4'-phosphopantetheinyl transferase